MKDKNFERALAIASKQVDSWPKWKQNILIVTAMATNQQARKPVVLPAADSRRAEE